MSSIFRITLLLLWALAVSHGSFSQTTVAYYEEKLPFKDSVVYQQETKYRNGTLKYLEYTRYGHYYSKLDGSLKKTWYKVFLSYSKKGILQNETLVAPPEKKGIYSRSYDRKGFPLTYYKYGHWALDTYTPAISNIQIRFLPVSAFKYYGDDSPLHKYESHPEPDLRILPSGSTLYAITYFSNADLETQAPDYQYDRFQVRRINRKENYSLSIYDHHLEDTVSRIKFWYDRSGFKDIPGKKTDLTKVRIFPDFGILYRAKGGPRFYNFDFELKFKLPNRENGNGYYFVKGNSPENSRIIICEEGCGLYKLNGEAVLPKKSGYRMGRFDQYVTVSENNDYFSLHDKNGKKVSREFPRNAKYRFLKPNYLSIKESTFSDDSVLYDIGLGDTVAVENAVLIMAERQGIQVKNQMHKWWIENRDGKVLFTAANRVKGIKLISKYYAIINWKSELNEPSSTYDFSLFELATKAEIPIDKSDLPKVLDILPEENFFHGPAKVLVDVGKRVSYSHKVKYREMYLSKTGKLIRTDTFPAKIIRVTHHGQFLVRKGSKKGVISKNGKIIIPIENYECLPYREGYLVRKKGKVKMLSKNGDVLVPARDGTIADLIDAYNWEPFTTLITKKVRFDY